MKKGKWHILIFLALFSIVLNIAVGCVKTDVVYAPNFTLQSVDDEWVNLTDFLGRPVMLTFWRINCSACQFQAPFTQALYDKWSSDVLVVLTINVGDGPSQVRDYMSSRGITYPVLLDQEHEVTQAYGLRGVPTTFFIDGQGVVKARQIGAFMDENSMESAVKRVFPSIVFSPKTNTASDIGGAAPDIGKAAPDFTLQSIDDRSVSLADFRGKTVLLNFWASPCQACLTEFPYFQTALANRNDQQEVILTVNCGDTSQTVHSIVDPIKPSFTVLLDPEGNVCTEYKRGVPTAFLIDGDGIIRAIKDNIFESSGEVETMLDILK